jgi:hypothetical protein
MPCHCVRFVCVALQRFTIVTTHQRATCTLFLIWKDQTLFLLLVFEMIAIVRVFRVFFRGEVFNLVDFRSARRSLIVDHDSCMAAALRIYYRYGTVQYKLDWCSPVLVYRTGTVLIE